MRLPPLLVPVNHSIDLSRRHSDYRIIKYVAYARVPKVSPLPRLHRCARRHGHDDCIDSTP